MYSLSLRKKFSKHRNTSDILSIFFWVVTKSNRHWFQGQKSETNSAWSSDLTAINWGRQVESVSIRNKTSFLGTFLYVFGPSLQGKCALNKTWPKLNELHWQTTKTPEKVIQVDLCQFLHLNQTWYSLATFCLFCCKTFCHPLRSVWCVTNWCCVGLFLWRIQVGPGCIIYSSNDPGSPPNSLFPYILPPYSNAHLTPHMTIHLCSSHDP